ncbi:hypothetical protein [Paenibacillus sp. 22594]|uniref:hypothetical protein n=1 Tax=Paenibacillus sp. 22594 TaxID=3453947 RepID=UPI003F868163
MRSQSMENLLEGERVLAVEEEEQQFIRQVAEQRKILYGIAYSYLRMNPMHLKYCRKVHTGPGSDATALRTPGGLPPG